MGVIHILLLALFLAAQIYLMMGLAPKIDSAFATENREKLKNIDVALKLQDHKAAYIADLEAHFLKAKQAKLKFNY